MIPLIEPLLDLADALIPHGEKSPASGWAPAKARAESSITSWTLERYASSMAKERDTPVNTPSSTVY